VTRGAARTVCVFGAYDAAADSEDYAVAVEVGRVLAELGCAVACGGYGGVMEAACRGAKGAGGATVGVTCAVFSSRPNAYVDRVIEAPDLPARVRTLMDVGTGGYVVLRGANGTLAELAILWEAKCLGRLADRPLVCVGQFWRPVVEMMRSVRPRSADHVQFVSGPSDLRAVFGSRQ